MELSLYMRKETAGIFDVELLLKNGEEVILVVRKNTPPAGTPAETGMSIETDGGFAGLTPP
ncbi:MAG: hypothetical protein M1377_01425, partial [Deltaproteobacteria bacterium]|nr:hypothetical protein [Deltaproteobacteria bacterium]